MIINVVHEKLKSLLEYAENDFYTDDWWKEEEWWKEVNSFYQLHQQEFNLHLFKEVEIATQRLDHRRINALLLLIQGSYYLDNEEEERLAVLFYELLEKLLLDLGPPYSDLNAWNLVHVYDIIWHNPNLYKFDKERIINIIEKTRAIECANDESGTDCQMALYKAVDLLRLISTSQSLEVLKRYLNHRNEDTRIQAKRILKEIENTNNKT